ncbi:MAG: HEPN domain-containing protein [Desulfurococcales archaeon]|nr:HEPN domain-containing protein [Desulfurococcales archaeon]
MLDESEYARWAMMAEATLASAEGDRDRGDYNWACFKAQQAAEIALKALARGAAIPVYGHSVSRILAVLTGRGLKPSGEVRECTYLLDKYYIPTRYPDAWPEGSPHEYYTRREADEAIRCARLILEWVAETWRSLKREGS